MSWLTDIGDNIGNAAGGAMDKLSGKSGLDTAAQGARDAQSQANALSELQWQRQMQGLQQALGMMNPSQSLYDRIYGTNTAQTRNAQAVPPGGVNGPSQAPYNQSMAPRQVGPGQFLPAGRVAGDAIIQQHIADRNLPPSGGAGAVPGLVNGAGVSPYGGDWQAPGDAIAAHLAGGASAPSSAMSPQLSAPTNPYLARLQQSLGLRLG
jgi:hypothetical protein